MDSSSFDKTPTAAEGGSPKKSKKKLKKEDAWRPEGPRDPFVMLDSLPEKKQQEIQRALHLFSPGPSLPRTLQQAESHAYRFWDTQPVPRLGDKTAAHGPIAEGEVSVREEPYSLPQGFSWDTPDLSSPTVLNELRALLNENYRGEDDNTIRRDFSPEYLQWALQPPNWQAHWHCGVRVDTNNKLVGFIAAVPADVCAYETQQRMAQVKLLCVHKKLRLKRMTPVLIRELTRRVSRQGVRQAVYAAGVVLPTPLSSCRYWHRPLNPRKLMEVNYPGLRQNMNLQRALKFNRLPAVTKTKGLRPMTERDVAGTHSLLQTNGSKFQLRPVWSPQEVEHWLLPREGVIDTYVVEGDGGALTDVVSFYSVSSRVLNHPVHADLRAAHLLHMASSATDLADLMEDTVVLAKSKGFDVFSALDVMDNRSFLDKLKFSVSDSSLHYYLYNWMCPSMSPDKVGLVLPN
ncbi:glycylpeptide N-tetradecanoyltransferase 2 isoform X1 [Scophthalmus maximus]|uniref:glycylpeptide N-tetradecanoyltransferase 2 isoform X1 n=1 Tax=Scophthalmus maximus TaxID=52904 RepID=UPI000F3327DB|nr:glycylpeptide N-tetradecanoyltransferase 2 isoform X1 [Scophthalmus maximus]